MNALHRKLLRDLLQARFLLLAITSMIAVGITTFVSLRSSYHNLDEAQRRYYRQCRMADFWIDVNKMPLAEVSQLAGLPGVTEVAGRIRSLANVRLREVEKPVNVLVISLPAKPAGVLNGAVLKRGQFFSGQRPHEVVVNQAFAKARHLHPGDTFQLVLNRRLQTVVMVGIATSSEFAYLLPPGSILPDPENFGVVYVSQSFAEDAFDFTGAANQVIGRLASRDPGQRAVTLARIERLLEPYGVLNVTPLKEQPSHNFLSGEIAGLGAVSAVLPFVFLVVAALILNILLCRMARQQRTIVGTLKALGYADRTIFFHFLKFGICVGALGSLLGSLLGYLAATGMTLVYGAFFELPDLRSQFYWYLYGSGLLISMSCSAAGCLQGARSMLLLQPATAMRPEPPPQGRRILLERVSWVWTRLSTAWRMALRGLLRNRLRTAVGVFASAMGSGLLVVGFLMFASTWFLIDFQFFRVSRSDLDLVFKSTQDHRALEQLRALPGVDRAEPLFQVGCTLVHENHRYKTGVTGLSRGAQLTIPRNATGSIMAVPESGLILTQRLAEILHVSTGDLVTLIPVKGSRRPVFARVKTISSSFLGLAAYARLDYLAELVDEEFAMTAAQLRIQPSLQDELLESLKSFSTIESLVSRQEMIANLMATMLAQLWVGIGFIVAFAGILFFGSIFNNSLVNLSERESEVATLIALGYSPWQIGHLFLRETVVTNFMGTALGLPFGYLLMKLAALAYAENNLIRLPVVQAAWVWYATVLLSLVFMALAHASVQRRIVRMNYLEALKVRE
ncbi:MAG: ABC transporter permease [Planctomycetota bacterium]|nr:ABC transporter permease [Planctomycetota bacterium]